MDAYKALMVHGSTQSVKDKMATFEEYNDALDLNLSALSLPYYL